MAKFKYITNEEASDTYMKVAMDTFDHSVEFEKFIKTYSFDEQPSHHAKMMSTWSRKHLTLLWNQYIAYEEAYGECVWGLHAGTSLGERTGVEQLRGFYDFIGGTIDVYEKELEKEKKES